MNVGEIIELVGGEVTWEILNADGTWYVIASHHGEGEDRSFRFEHSNKVLTKAVRAAANDALSWWHEKASEIRGY